MSPLEGMTSIGRFSDEELVAGDEESRRRAREEHRKQQRLHFAESSPWPRIDFADLRFGRFVVENTRTGGSEPQTIATVFVIVEPTSRQCLNPRRHSS